MRALANAAILLGAMTLCLTNNANIRVAPVLTIRNGVARFDALNLTFQGYVTPQGELAMQSQGGQMFEGHIDPYYVLKGRVTGNCIYDATWTKNQSPRV
jgi:hypothetical protein